LKKPISSDWLQNSVQPNRASLEFGAAAAFSSERSA